MEELNNPKIEISSVGMEENIVKKENIYLLIGSIILAVVYNILFYEKELGISYPIFVLAFYGVLLFTLRDKIVFKINFGTMLTIPIVMLSFAYMFFSNAIFMFFNFLIIPMLIFMQTLLITNNNDYKWFDARFILDLLNALFVRTFSYILKPFSLISKILKKKTNSGKASVISKVVIGLLLSVPLIAVVIALLSEADEVFSHWMGNISDLFINLSIGDFTAQLIIGLIIGSLIFSYLWSLYYQNNRQTGKNIVDNVQIRKVWDPVIVLTMLISVNLIYVVFTIIQFTYLFGSISSLLPQGVTYAEYARRGFFELVAVTLINVSILTSIINLTKNDNAIVSMALKVLNTLLVACTMVMLLSAHFRMSLYEEEYGYTYLRVFTHAFMIFIFVILIATLIKVWRESFSLLKSYIVVAIIAYIAINYFNADVFIVNNNIRRFETNTGEIIDTYYLTSLSDDAVPYMVTLLGNKNEQISSDIRHELKLRKERLAEKNDWQSFNLSHYRAKLVLDEYGLN
ncbi:DUF4153 domain-containing protein [Acetivibrio cellulolyticus]|uniref:DUF4153 domain-containing protein n=1 Tax=Acetivibrio cellulolyticus TaxID=35830 RepID=UPI0001E2EB51|nr:DUF4173 domain-containing protein [Acetivibrio cellulolyticus]